MASAHLEEDLECSVCLNVYTNPVTLKCGHKFCPLCIGRVLNTQKDGGYSCPDCREEFQDGPVLQKNFTLCKISETLQTTQSDQDKTGIFCTYCIHTSVPAVISCLHCEASLCDDHLRVHSKSPEHVLCDPTTSPEKRKCSVHKKILEYYCTEDSTSICVSCRLDGEHRGHQVETLDEKLRDVLQKLEIKEELSRKMGDIEEMCNVTDPMTVLRESDTGDLCDTEDGDEDRERHDKLLHDGGDLDVVGISHTLNTGLSDIMSGVIVEKCPGTHVYPHSTTKGEGHINAEPARTCHQPSPTIQPSRPHTQPSPTIQPARTCHQPSPTIQPSRPHTQPSPTIQPARTCHQPSPTIQPHTQSSPTKQCSPNIMALQQTWGASGVTDILLDVRTAGNNLHISDDRKTLTWSVYRSYPEAPERFRCPQVMSSQSFSSGRHYWEVDVGGSRYWTVGMCYPSIERRGDLTDIGYHKKSWCLERLGCNRYSVIHDDNKTRLPGGVSSERVRIDLDYKAGRISFYDLCDPIRHLHTFTTTFTEPLHAEVWVGDGHIKICGRESEVRNLPRNW